MRATRMGLAIETGFFLVIFGAVAVHSAILMLNDGPDNAIKIQATGFLQRYMNPFISQGFSFFAPKPIDHDDDFFIRGEEKPGHWTPWLDVGQYLTDKIAANRLSNFDLIAQSVRNQTLNAASLADPKVRKKVSNLYSYASVQYLERTGFAFLRYEYPHENLLRVQTGIEQRVFPRFTRRFENRSHSHVTFFFLGTDAAPRDVAQIRW